MAFREKISQFDLTSSVDFTEQVPLIRNGKNIRASLSTIFEGHGILNVKSFGAIGDGVADDTVAIQSVFNFLTATSVRDPILGVPVNGITVFFPAGTYIISNELVLPAISSSLLNVPIIVAGAGQDATQIRQTTLNNGFVSRDAWDVTTYGQIMIQDLSITNSKTYPFIANYNTGSGGQIWKPSTFYASGAVVAFPGPSNRLLQCAISGTSGNFTPFGQLWSGYVSNPSENDFALPTDPIIQISGSPAAQYKQMVLQIATSGSADDKMTFYWSTNGHDYTGPISATLYTTLGTTGLTASFTSGAVYPFGRYYCSPPYSTGFSIIVGDKIKDGTATWNVIDGGCGFLQENGGGGISVQRCAFYGWVTGICFDQTETALINNCNIQALNGIWLVNANERSNAATAVSQPGSSTNVIRIRDINFNAGAICYVDSGGVDRVVEMCNGEMSNDIRSWLGWIVGTSRTKISNFVAEGSAEGFFIGSIAPFTGIPNYPTIGLEFEHCLIAPKRGACFDSSFVSGTPYENLTIRQCQLTWHGSTGSVKLNAGNGIRLEDNVYSDINNFFDVTIPFRNGVGNQTLLWSQSENNGAGMGFNCVPQINGLDINSSLATRAVSVTVSSGFNNDITNPGVSACELTGATSNFTITGIAGGTEGQEIRLTNFTNHQMTIAHNSGSTASNQILCFNNANFSSSAAGFSSVLLKYSSNQSRWLLLGGIY